MQPIYIFNDKTIKIQIINNEIYYEAFIPNNNINKKLIENTVFKFEKSDSVIITHDDNNVFQLGKMECSYSDYIEIKKQLEDNKKEQDLSNIYYKKQIDQLKQELSNNTNLLQKQIKETDNLKNEINVSLKLLQQQIKLSNDKLVEDNDNIFPIKDLINYEFGKSIILECLVNDKQITKFKYKSTLCHIYNLINDKIKIIKNTKLNIIMFTKVDNGFYYLDNLGISVQRADSNKSLLEIITQCIENKIKLYMEIQLIDNNIIEIKVIESIFYFIKK
jgi:hypothetical protein